MVVIDATGHVIGRLSSAVAKRLLNGEDVVIVNAEKSLITGRRGWLLNEFRERRERGSQRKGPFYPRRPDRILWRSIRGMVPYQQPRGREAMKHLRVYVSLPAAVKDQPLERVPGADRVNTVRYMTLGEISERLGGSF